MFSPSSGFYSQMMHALFVTVDVHHGGEEYRPRDMPPLDCSSTVSAANASLIFFSSRLFEEDNE
jgi:hypothetical protein